PELARVEHVVTTSIFRPEPALRGLVLPVTAELERTDSGWSYWGSVERSPLANPLSGSREFSSILGWFGEAAPVEVPSQKPAAVREVLKATEAVMNHVYQSDGFVLLGEKKAIGIRGFYDTERKLSLNISDALAMGIQNGDIVSVKSSSSEGEFEVHVTDSVAPGTGAIGVNVHSNRALFPLVDDPVSGETTVPMTYVVLTKTGRRVRPSGDNPSVWT
ncbi:MAG: molybdopterin dinucleotide binding domain-containing protein, partial [candidate division WOR-3 bacterium]